MRSKGHVTCDGARNTSPPPGPPAPVAGAPRRAAGAPFAFDKRAPAPSSVPARRASPPRARRGSARSPGGDELVSVIDKSQLEIQAPDNLTTETLSSNP